MKKITRWLNNLFTPKELFNLDVKEILACMNEEPIRKLWLYECFQELKRINLEIDKRLVTHQVFNLTDLAARRKAYQDVLEAILSAKRQLKTHNPKSKTGEFDLDSVTVDPAYI